MRGSRNLATTVDADTDDLSGFGSKLFVKRWLAHPLKVGSVIPVELYLAVAEILAYVYRTRQQRGAWRGSAMA